MSRLKLSDVEWEIFKIKDIFEISKVFGKPIEKYDTGDIPYASTANTNNAIQGFVSANKEDISPRNVISIDPIKGKAIYHPYKFVGRGFSGASINLLQNNKLNKYSALFICKCIEQTSSKKASYGYLFNSDRLLNGKFKLPILSNGVPNWQFMEDYIKQEQKIQARKIIDYYEQKMMKTAFDLVGLEDVKSKTFSFTEIFREIKRGKRLKKADHIVGDIPYVSSTALNNGVDSFVGNTESIRSYKNNLSLANSGSVGSCFYHVYEYIASDHVTGLTLKNPDKNIYLFMSTVISRISEKYSFSREINDLRITREKIMLPADSKGNPNWEYISKFMKKIELEKLEKVLPYIYI